MPAKGLWPAHESLYDLMIVRATIGVAAFNSERQNDPQNPELAEWPAEYFDWPGLWFDVWPATLDVKTLALDPSKGRDAKHGDFSAYVRLGRDRTGVLYVEADLRRRNAEEIVADGIEHVKEFKPDGFAIETNQFQELLIAPFLTAAQAQRSMRRWTRQEPKGATPALSPQPPLTRVAESRSRINRVPESQRSGLTVLPSADGFAGGASSLRGAALRR
jgi:hypothetical protein